jgi:peptidoglycan/LPS O-acetylase OafA/YrhL
MQYNRALDGVRALAILAVVSFHCAAPWGSGGFLGVDVFFVLSGYLITSLLLAEHRQGGIDVGAFYVRRALRLYPTLLLLLVAYVALAPVLWPTEDRWLVAALNGVYVMDYALAFWNVPGTVGHTWSLGVEEKFYLLWPLLLPLLLRTRRPIAWLLAAFFMVTAWRYFATFEWGWIQAYFSFDTRMSGILLGAIAALTRLRVSKPTVAVACVALALAVVVPVIATTPRSIPVNGVTLGITLAECSAFVLICYLAEHANSPFLASKPMAYIGRLSYGIYLWHFPLVVLLRDRHSQPWWITLSATLLFSFSMAAICLRFVDGPIRKWRKSVTSQSHRLAIES